jgi:hypothetical protein
MQMKVGISEKVSRDHPIRRGVILDIKNQFSLDKRLVEQLSPAETGVAFTADQRFLDRALHIFSKPYVYHAAFYEWKDAKGKVWKQGYDHPDIVSAQLAGSGHQKISIMSSMDSIHLEDPPCFLTITKDTEGYFEIPVDELKGVLDHISGVSLPEWIVARIAIKLANDRSSDPFHVKVPKDPRQLALLPRPYLEYFDAKWLSVQEEFDSETKFLTQIYTHLAIEKCVILVNAKDQLIRFSYIASKRRLSQVCDIQIYTNGKGPVALPEARIADILFMFTGVPIPGPYITFVARKLASVSEKSLFGVNVYPDLDSKIWELLLDQNRT